MAANAATGFAALGIVAVPLQADLERLQHVNAGECLLPLVHVCLRDGVLARLPGQREFEQCRFSDWQCGGQRFWFMVFRQGRPVRRRFRRGRCRLRHLRARVFCC